MADVALLRVELGSRALPAIGLDVEMDEGLEDGYVLERVLVVGYPRVPTPNRAYQVAATGEVVSFVKTFHGPPGAEIVISHIPRGGLSGAPVLMESGRVLGIVSDALQATTSSSEPGFTSALSIEPALRLFAAKQWIPMGISEDDWSAWSMCMFPLGIAAAHAVVSETETP